MIRDLGLAVVLASAALALASAAACGADSADLASTSSGGGAVSTGSDGGATSHQGGGMAAGGGHGGATVASAGAGGGGGGGGSQPAACATTDTGDLPGLTRQCDAGLTDTYLCFEGLPCSTSGPVADLYNVFGLTPWFGNYDGPVVIDQGQVSVADTSLHIFGARWTLTQSMNYSGFTEEVCLDDATKFVSLRFIPNGDGLVQLASNTTFLVPSDVSVSTEPGLFDPSDARVLVSSSSGGSANILLTTVAGTAGYVLVDVGSTYYFNFTARSSTPQSDGRCTSGLAGSFTYYSSLHM